MSCILVINSNRALRLRMRDLLKVALPQLQVLTSENAKDAITLAHRKRPFLILLGADMPGVSSAQIAQALRALPETHAIPVVAVPGAQRQTGAIADDLRESCDDCLPLSDAPVQLLATVQRYLPHAGGLPVAGVMYC